MSKYDKEQILRTSGVNVLKCMRCGKCTATCPSSVSYTHLEPTRL